MCAAHRHRKAPYTATDVHKCTGANLARSSRGSRSRASTWYMRGGHARTHQTHTLSSPGAMHVVIFGWRKGERRALRVCVRAPNARGDLDDSPGRFIDTVYVDEPHYSGQVGSATLAQDKRACTKHCAICHITVGKPARICFDNIRRVKHQFLFISE